MSTTSLHSRATLPSKRLAYTVASLAIAAAILFLPQAQHALPLGARPAHAAAMLLKPAATLLPHPRNFWHTDGNRILDAENRPVRISGVNWSGFETKEAVPGGLDFQDYRAILRTMKKSGYNTVRIPFSNEMIEMPSVPDRIRFKNMDGAINTDLHDLTSLEILDKIVAYSGKIGLKVILDNHRSEAGSSAEESGLWYSQQFPESAWIEDWTALARRYQNNSTVIGMDLRNEPHNADKGGACWDCGGQNDWHRAATRAGDAVLAVNPRLLIFVEGVDTYAGDTYWWGGNLEGVRRSPIRLSVPNRLVYSAHEYGPTEYAQPWFNAMTSPATLAATWRRHWAYVSESGIAPVWIGEFGTPNDDVDVQSPTPGSEGQWFTGLIAFLGNHPAVGWTYWGINGEDRYGLLDRTYSDQPANLLKSEALASVSQSSPARIMTQTSAAFDRVPEENADLPVTFQTPAITSVLSTAVPKISGAFAAPSVVSNVSGDPAAAPDGDMRKDLHVDNSQDASIQSAIVANVHKAVSSANRSLEGEIDLQSR